MGRGQKPRGASDGGRKEGGGRGAYQYTDLHAQPRIYVEVSKPQRRSQLTNEKMLPFTETAPCS